MTIEQRLEFIRAGYSKADILEFEAAQDFARGEEPAEEHADPAPAEEHADPEPAEEHAESAPAWATALQASIDKLTAATQRANVLFDDMGGESDRETKADAALGQYITGGKKAGKK